MRLAKLKKRVVARATEKWATRRGALLYFLYSLYADLREPGAKKEKAKLVNRVLDVQQGELCFIVGTIYMDMKLKPNVLEEIAREVSNLACSGLY